MELLQSCTKLLISSIIHNDIMNNFIKSMIPEKCDSDFGSVISEHITDYVHEYFLWYCPFSPKLEKIHFLPEKQ